jgi:hypothetical protein
MGSDVTGHTTRPCRHCGRSIAYGASWTVGWFHVATLSVWCDASATTQAAP